METKLKDKTTKVAFSKAIDLALKHVKKDPVEGMKDITKIMDKYIMPKSSEENSAKHALERIRAEFANPSSKWASFAEEIVDEVDDHVLKQFIMTVAYNAVYKGNAKRNELQRQYNCNIPWAILFDPTSACNLECKGCWAAEYGHKNNLSYEEMEDIVRQANEIGCYFFLLTGGEPMVRKDDIIKLANEFNESEFFLFTMVH